MLSIKVPPLGESIVEATVSRWLKKQGDSVTSGETIVELETDKITVEVPAPQGGVLSSTAVAEGDVVKVDQLLGELDETAAAATAAPASGPSAAPAPTPAPASAPAAAPETAPPQAAASSSAADVKSAPSARRAADE